MTTGTSRIHDSFTQGTTLLSGAAETPVSGFHLSAKPLRGWREGGNFVRA